MVGFHMCIDGVCGKLINRCPERRSIKILRIPALRTVNPSVGCWLLAETSDQEYSPLASLHSTLIWEMGKRGEEVEEEEEEGGVGGGEGEGQGDRGGEGGCPLFLSPCVDLEHFTSSGSG